MQWLADQADTNLILRDSLSTEPVIYSKSADLNGAIGINSLTTYFSSVDGFSYEREIKFLEWDEESAFWNDQIIRTAIHEVAHSWDSAAEINNVFAGSGDIWDSFLAVSSWTQTNPGGNDFLNSFDGQWYYHQDASFAYSYSRTNPREDFATTFEVAYDESLGVSINPSLNSKLAHFHQLMAVFQNV